MKKVKVVKKVIVKEKKYVTPGAIQNEVSRILAVEAFNRWRDFFEMDDAMDDFEYCLEKFCESRCEGRWFSMGLVFAGLIDAGEMSFGRVLFYVADKNESFIDSFLEHFTACAAEELFFDDEEEEEEPKEEDVLQKIASFLCRNNHEKLHMNRMCKAGGKALHIFLCYN